MKFFVATLALIGTAAAASSFSTVPVAVPTSSMTVTPSSTVSATATPSCDVESDGDNGNHYGWCKKANHYGTYWNGKSGDADNLGPSDE